jgi:hypothetical protein
MAAATSPVLLPNDLLDAAHKQAERDGVPLDLWLSSALADRLGASEQAQNFFRARASRARKGALRAALDAVRTETQIPVTNSKHRLPCAGFGVGVR